MFFLPLVKADEEKRLVFARAAAEEPDKAREIMDYATARPQFEAWSDGFRNATLGKSLGNIRAMHNPRHLAGKVQDIVFDDAAKTVDVVVKVLDPTDWQKVEEGGYTGLSIGGGYLKKWQDGELTRYTPRIAEISLVDSPCIPSARIMELQKSDGGVEEVLLKGNPHTFAQLLPPPTFSDHWREYSKTADNSEYADGLQKGLLTSAGKVVMPSLTRAGRLARIGLKRGVREYKKAGFVGTLGAPAYTTGKALGATIGPRASKFGGGAGVALEYTPDLYVGYKGVEHFTNRRKKREAAKSAPDGYLEKCEAIAAAIDARLEKWVLPTAMAVGGVVAGAKAANRVLRTPVRLAMQERHMAAERWHVNPHAYIDSEKHANRVITRANRIKAGAIVAGAGGGYALGRVLENAQAKDPNQLKKPRYMTKAAPPDAMTPPGATLTDKEHGQRIAAAKARWLKEGHHDVDPHFDQKADHAGGAVLGRMKKVSAVAQERGHFWHGVADTQEAYDTVRQHLPKHASLMMEVPHQHGLLYNPEAIGAHHFDDNGQPHHDLYMLHPAEADDWVAKHGKGAKTVGKAAPGGLVQDIRDLGPLGGHSSGRITRRIAA